MFNSVTIRHLITEAPKDTLAGSDWLAPVVPGAQISGWVLKDVQLCSWRIGEMMSAGKTVAWKKSIALNTHKSFILEVITPHTLLIMAQVIFQVIKYPNIETKTEIYIVTFLN